MSNYKKAFKLRKHKLINYIKKDYCEYNGETPFLELNKLMLENYLEYYSICDNVVQCEESRLRIVTQLKEALVIVNRLLADEYDNEVMTWVKAHNKTISFLRNPVAHKTTILGEDSILEEKHLADKYIKEHPEAATWIHGCKGEWDSEDSYITWKQLNVKAEKARTKDYKDFFSYIAKHCREWWD